MENKAMNLVDMHCDTISELLHKRRKGEEGSLFHNSGHVDVEKLKRSGYLLQNFALFVELSAQPDPWQEVQELYALYMEELERNQEFLAPVLRYSDIETNRKEGKISSMLTVEEGGVCLGQISRLEELYRMGVRMLTLTWNYDNELGCPNLERKRGRQVREEAGGMEGAEKTKMIWSLLNTPNTEGGLTEKGFEFVERMEELGMIPDVSHLSDKGFYDVLRTAKKPFVASHSNARGQCPNVRNLSDHMIYSLAEKGGVIGLNFYADFLVQLPPGVYNPGSMGALVRHAKHITNMGGMECLGLGSDFDGIDTNEALPDAGRMELLYEGLKKGGFYPYEIDKIFSGNVLRLYRETL